MKAAFSASSPPWQYWNYCGGRKTCPRIQQYGGAALPSEERFLLFDSRGAGWNNDRQSVELAYALAYLWKRTLVLPEWIGNPCDLSSLTTVNTTFDIGAMAQGVRVISASEFVVFAQKHPKRFPGGAAAVQKLHVRNIERHKPFCKRKSEWLKFPGWYAGLKGVAERIFPDVREFVPWVVLGESLPDPDVARLKGSSLFQHFATHLRSTKGPLALSERQHGATALYIGPRKLLGNFYSTIYVPSPTMSWQLRNTIRSACHLRPEFFVAAAAALEAEGLKPGEYGAIHDRQGDFQKAYKGWYLDPHKPGKFLQQPQNLKFVKQHSRIYMAVLATKQQEEALERIFYPAIRREMAEPKMIVGFSKKAHDAAKRIAGHLKGWEGIVEMIICAQANMFLGSVGSTFSGYIHRLRGYMPHVDDKRILFTDSSQSGLLARTGLFTKLATPTWNVSKVPADISWKREWPEGFDIW
jgi:hypothetical protein